VAYDVRELFWEKALFDGTLHDAWIERLWIGQPYDPECTMVLCDVNSKDVTYELRFYPVPLLSRRVLLDMRGSWGLEPEPYEEPDGCREAPRKRIKGSWDEGDPPDFVWAEHIPAEEQQRMGMDAHCPGYHAARIWVRGDCEIDIVFRECHVTRLEWVADKTGLAQKRQEREREEAESRRVLAPLIKDIQDAGFPQVGSFADIVDPCFDHTPLLPLLLDHAKRDYPSSYRMDILWLFATREALFAWDDLLGLCKALNSEDGTHPISWCVVCSLIAMADEEHAPGLLGLIEGKCRSSWLERLSPVLIRYVPEAPRLFEQWAADPDEGFALQARECLSRYRIWMAKQERYGA